MANSYHKIKMRLRELPVSSEGFRVYDQFFLPCFSYDIRGWFSSSALRICHADERVIRVYWGQPASTLEVVDRRIYCVCHSRRSYLHIRRIGPRYLASNDLPRQFRSFAGHAPDLPCDLFVDKFMMTRASSYIVSLTTSFMTWVVRILRAGDKRMAGSRGVRKWRRRPPYARHPAHRRPFAANRGGRAARVGARVDRPVAKFIHSLVPKEFLFRVADKARLGEARAAG
jgi:hypothetical protein